MCYYFILCANFNCANFRTPVGEEYGQKLLLGLSRNSFFLVKLNNNFFINHLCVNVLALTKGFLSMYKENMEMPRRVWMKGSADTVP